MNRFAKKVGRFALKSARRYVPKGTGRAAGAALGALAGPMGSRLGSMVGAELSNITGVGSYRARRARAPKAYVPRGSRQVIRGKGDYDMVGDGSIMNPRTAFAPRVKNSDMDVIFSRTEYLGDVISSANGTPSNFQITSYNVNPGLDIADGGSFSYLPQIAAGFQHYRFEQLVFEYRSMSGSATGANTSLGQIIMAANYDPTQANYGDKRSMLDSQFAVSCSPEKNMLFPVECAHHEQLFPFHDIRTGAIKANQNQSIYDLCNFQLASTGCPANGTNLGELHVTYTVRLSKTQTNGKGVQARTANYRYSQPTGTGDVLAGTPLGANAALYPFVPSVGNNLLLTFQQTNSPLIFMPPSISAGTYLIIISWRNATAVAWAAPTFTYTNAKASLCIFSPNPATAGAVQNSQNILPITTPTSTVYSNYQFFTITGSNASIALGVSGTLGTNIEDVNIIITQVNTNACMSGT